MQYINRRVEKVYDALSYICEEYPNGVFELRPSLETRDDLFSLTKVLAHFLDIFPDKRITTISVYESKVGLKKRVATLITERICK